MKGRWEVVRPGDPLPDERDLLSEASLPIEERGTQARFTQLSRFNIFLPPGGRFVLPGPDAARLPASVPGQYLLLLRIEASDDRENDSDLGAAGSGKGIVHSGGATGFPLPVLRYVVGGGDNTRDVTTGTEFAALLPRDGAVLPANLPLDFTWEQMPQAAFYRLEIVDGTGRLILSAALKSIARTYRAPSWLKDKAGDATLQWRVAALDQSGHRIGETTARSLGIARSK